MHCFNTYCKYLNACISGDYSIRIHRKFPRAYLRGGGLGDSTPPTFSDFFLKSEGKEVERKRKKIKGMWGGGAGVRSTC